MADWSKPDDQATHEMWLTPETAIPRAKGKCEEIQMAIERNRSRTITQYTGSIADAVPVTDIASVTQTKKAIESLRSCARPFFRSIDVDGLGDNATWYLSEAEALGGNLIEIQVVSWTHPAGDIATQMKNLLEEGARPKIIKRTWYVGKQKKHETHLVGSLVDYTFKDGSPSHANFVTVSDRPLSADQVDDFSEEDDFTRDEFALRSLITDIDLEQNREIRGPMEGVFILTGGPGVGKTSVGLHRIPFLINEQQAILGAGKEAERVPFFRADNQLVLVWKEHLVPYLRKLAQNLAGGFPDHNVRHVNTWLTDMVRDYVKIGGRGGWNLREADEAFESWKRNLTEFELEDFLQGHHHQHLEAQAELQKALPTQEDVPSTLFDPDPRRSTPVFDLNVQSLPFYLDSYQTKLEQLLSKIPKGRDLQRFSEMQQTKFKAVRDQIQGAFEAAMRRMTDYTGMLFDFYMDREVVDLLASEFEDFDRERYLNAVSRQKAEKVLSVTDICLLLWVINFVTDGSTATQKSRRPLTRYAHILIDEAQYYDVRLLRLFKSLIFSGDREGVLTIVGDVEQNVSVTGGIIKWDDLELDLAPDQIRRLGTNYRWSREVFEFVECLHAILKIEEPLKRPTRWRVRGGKQAEIVCKDDIHELFEVAAGRVVDIRDDSRTRSWRIAFIFHHADVEFGRQSTKDLVSAGVAARWAEGADVNNSIDNVIFTTSEHIVGLEFDAVFMIGFKFSEVAAVTAQERSSLWVALTRAKRFLFVGRLRGDKLLEDAQFDKFRLVE